MKRWIICSLFAAALAVAPAFGQGSGSSNSAGKPGSGFSVMKSATGKLAKDVSRREMKIEAEGSKLTLRITDETDIAIERDGETKPASQTDLKQGRNVRVKYTVDNKTAVEVMILQGS